MGSPVRIAAQGASARQLATARNVLKYRKQDMQPSLSLNRQFSIAVHSRAIDNCNDIEELRKVAKTLLSAWQHQAEFSEHYGAQALGIRP